jgi:LmbE family N-acetylglucosaminyl deacetylase
MSLIDFNTPRKWLFCMTHPDDEISVCATMRRLVQAGHEVRISWTHSSDFRLKEGVAAAALIGVGEDNLYHHNSTDGSTCDELADLLPSFRAMMTHAKPDFVVCGAFEQGHLDHDATNWLVNQTFGGTILEVPFYHTYIRPNIQRINQFSDPTDQEVIVLDKAEQRFKLDFAKQFRSQNIWRVLLTFEIVSALLLQPAMLRKREIFRKQTHRDFRTPNHPERLARKVEQTPRWEHWVSAVTRAESLP